MHLSIWSCRFSLSFPRLPARWTLDLTSRLGGNQRRACKRCLWGRPPSPPARPLVTQARPPALAHPPARPPAPQARPQAHPPAPQARPPARIRPRARPPALARPRARPPAPQAREDIDDCRDCGCWIGFGGGCGGGGVGGGVCGGGGCWECIHFSPSTIINFCNHLPALV